MEVEIDFWFNGFFTGFVLGGIMGYYLLKIEVKKIIKKAFLEECEREEKGKETNS